MTYSDRLIARRRRYLSHIELTAPPYRTAGPADETWLQARDRCLHSPDPDIRAQELVFRRALILLASWFPPVVILVAHLAGIGLMLFGWPRLPGLSVAGLAAVLEIAAVNGGLALAVSFLPRPYYAAADLNPSS